MLKKGLLTLKYYPVQARLNPVIAETKVTSLYSYGSSCFNYCLSGVFSQMNIIYLQVIFL
jgi:uncharacterized membrane protein YfbV (UPF0208 family)